MSPILWKICNTPVLGFVVWLTNQCAIPALMEPAPVSLARPGMILKQQVSTAIPDSHGYHVILNFRFDRSKKAVAWAFIGTGSPSESLSGSSSSAKLTPNKVPDGNLGTVIPLRIIVRACNDGGIVSDQIVNSNGDSSGAVDKSGMLTLSRNIGSLIWLRPGVYYVEVFNLNPQSIPSGIESSIEMR